MIEIAFKLRLRQITGRLYSFLGYSMRHDAQNSQPTRPCVDPVFTISSELLKLEVTMLISSFKQLSFHLPTDKVHIA